MKTCIVAVIVAKAEFVGERRSKDVCLAAGKVLAQKRNLSCVAESTTVENRTKRSDVRDWLMVVAETCEGLILRGYIPVSPSIPLEGIVYRVVLAGEVVIRLPGNSRVGVWKEAQQF